VLGQYCSLTAIHSTMTKRFRQVVNLLLVGSLYTLASLGVLITVFCGEFWDCSFTKVSCSEELKKLSAFCNFNSAVNRAGPAPSIRAPRLITASAHSPASPTRFPFLLHLTDFLPSHCERIGVLSSHQNPSAYKREQHLFHMFRNPFPGWLDMSSVCFTILRIAM
jgi:hypothetical protein